MYIIWVIKCISLPRAFPFSHPSQMSSFKLSLHPASQVLIGYLNIYPAESIFTSAVNMILRLEYIIGHQ